MEMVDEEIIEILVHGQIDHGGFALKPCQSRGGVRGKDNIQGPRQRTVSHKAEAVDGQGRQQADLNGIFQVEMVTEGAGHIDLVKRGQGNAGPVA